jgi:hypothetical protein
MHHYLLSAALLLCWFYSSAQLQGHTEPYAASYRIVSCSSEYVGIAYRIVGASKSIPPHYIKKAWGFTYEITVYVVVADGFRSSRTPFGIVCKLPDGQMQAVTLNETHTLVESVSPAPFKFRIDSAEKGIATLQFGVLRLIGNTVTPDPEVPPNMRTSVHLN